jgi:hypothetical protein
MLKVDGVLPADVHLVATVHEELVSDAPAKAPRRLALWSRPPW